MSFASFDLDAAIGDEEISSAQSSETISDAVKAKLQEMLTHLGKSIAVLVEDAEPIRHIFKELKGKLPSDLESAIIPAAFIEGHQPQISVARQKISERLAQQDIKKRDEGREELKTMQAQIKSLEAKPSQLEDRIKQLQATETELIKKLEEDVYPR